MPVEGVIIPATGSAGTSNPTVATDLVSGQHYQVVKLDVGGDGLSVPVVGTVPVSGTVTANAGTGPWPVTDNGGSLTVDGTVSITANSAVNVAQINGVTPDIGAGNAGTGTLRVVLATDQPQTTLSLKVAGNVASGAADSGNPVKVGGVFNSTPPTFTTGQRGDLQVTSNGSLKVDNSANTQPVSGTVTANAGTGTFTVAGTVTANAGTGTFTVADNQVVTDNAGFTDGTTKVFMGGFVFDEVAGTALTENDAAAARIDSKRAQVLVLEDGTTRGQRAAVSAAGRVSVDASGVAVPVTDNGGSLTVDGTVGVSGTVTVDTELNTTDLDTGAGVDTQAAVGILIGASGGSSPLSTSNAMPVKDNGGSLTVDAPVGTPVFARLSDGTAALTTTGGRLSVDGSGVTQPVSGTVTANIGTSGSLALDASVTGLQVAQGSTTAGQKGELVQGAVTTGNPTYTTAQTSPLSLDTAGALRVRIAASDVSSSGGTSAADGAAYTAGTTAGTPMMAARDDTTPGTVLEDKVGILRMSTRRELYSTIRDAAGNERGVNVTAGNALVVDGSASTQPVSGTVTANAGTGPFPVSDNAGSLTVDAPVGTPVFARLSDGTAALTTTSGRLAVDPSGVTSPVSIAAAVSTKYDVVTAATAAWTSATTVDTTASITVTGYGTVLVSLNPTSTFTGGGIIFEVSDDAGTTWYPIQGIRADSFTAEGSYTIVASTKRIWQFSVAGATNFRVRLNPVITGTGTANLRLQASAASVEPGVTVGGTLAVTESGTWTVQPGNTANTTPWLVTPTPGTAGGWSKVVYAAQTTTVQTVKGSAGTLGGYIIYNPNASAAYVQVFDNAGTITLGTTARDFLIPIPASSGANIEFTNGVNFANAIKLAATTTAGGSTAPGTGLDMTIIYK